MGIQFKSYLATFLKLLLQILCVLTEAKLGALQLTNHNVPLLQTTAVLV